MSDVESLALKRAEKEGNCKNVSPLDILRLVIRDIEAGAINPDKMIIHYMEPMGDHDHTGFYAAGVTYVEHAGLLAIAQSDLLHMASR